VIRNVLKLYLSRRPIYFVRRKYIVEGEFKYRSCCSYNVENVR